jgi:hypothetical protein
MPPRKAMSNMEITSDVLALKSLNGAY